MRPWSPKYPMDIGVRFWSKVDTSGDCWEWTGFCHPKGYGAFSIRKDGKRTTARAHRFAWEWLKGPIPEGMVLDHRCRNRRCVNPDHLRVVTPRVNATENRQNVIKTHCPASHPYDEQNTYVFVDGAGKTHRACRTCRAAADERRRLRQDV